MVPNGWEVKKLGDLCNLNPKKPLKPNDGIVSFIAMHQLSESGKVISTEDRFYDDVSKGFTSFKDKDVLVAKITPCFENGKGALVNNLTNGIGFGSTEFHVLRSKKGTCPEFIYYLTRTKELRVKGEMNMQGSAGHRRVTTDYFNAYKVLTPPLPEQRKIAKILSTWDKAIATTERLIATSQQQKKALMQQLLTGKKRLVNPDTGMVFEGDWEEKLFSDFFDIGSSKRILQSDWKEKGIPFYRTRELVSLAKRQPFSSEIFISEEMYCTITEKYGKPQSGDFLVSGVGTLGISYLVKDSDTFYFKDGNVLWFKSLGNVNSEFFKYCFESDFVQNQIINQTTITTVGTYTITNAKQTKFLCPIDTKEQQKIASVLTAADQEIELLEAKLAHLKDEKKALMQQLLTGKRRVKVDAMEAA